MPGQDGRAGNSGRTGRPPRCNLPSTCEPIDTLVFSMAPCCAPDNECGYEITRPPELRETLIQMAMASCEPVDTCVPASKIFVSQPGQDEQRIVTAGAPDQLLTPLCESRVLAAFPLIGCCMPNNRCGVSTYYIADFLQLLLLFPAPFTSVECVSGDEFNRQVRATTLGGLGQVPSTTGTCDYADLDARL